MKILPPPEAILPDYKYAFPVPLHVKVSCHSCRWQLSPLYCCIWKSAIMVLAPKLYQFLVGVFASMGSILFGYDLGVIAEV